VRERWLASPPTLGPRGEGWVALQTVVLAAGAACAALGPHWPAAVEPELRICGHVLEAVGLALVIAARFVLGASFTVLPRPRERSTLRRRGVYAHARHPIYGGLLLAGIGLALDRSALVFVPTAALAVVFLLKSIREEAWLTARYPDYGDYRRATRRRFVPWLV
jgi:protein-S-isoprenylcysteine O-methyltransferase Ste14